MHKKARLPILLSITLFVGLIIGAVVGATSGTIYLVIVSPAIAAMVTGLAAARLVRVLRVAHGLGAALAGGLGAATAVVVILAVSYQMQQAAIVTELSKVQGFSDEEVERQVARWKNKYADAGGSIGAWVMLRANAGVRLTEGTYLDLGTTGNALVLTAELVLAILIGARFAFNAGTSAFCPFCDTWYARRIVGSAPFGSHAVLKGALQNQQFYKLGRRLKEPKQGMPLLLHGRFCDTCDKGDVYLELELKELGKKPRIVASLTCPQSGLDAILDSQKRLI